MGGRGRNWSSSRQGQIMGFCKQVNEESCCINSGILLTHRGTSSFSRRDLLQGLVS